MLQVAKSLEVLIEVQTENGPFEARLDDLERRRAGWEAEIEAVLLKADSTLKAASNADSRSRTMLRHAEKLSAPLDLEGEEVEETVRSSDAPGSREEEVPAVPMVLEPSRKELALRYKFG